MLNIYYQPDYTKRKKLIFTTKLKDSIFLNKLIDVAYFFNYPIPDKYISNGPHKRMNNLIKTFKGRSDISFNNCLYDFSYIVQFDWFGEKVLNEIIKNPSSNKLVLVGPLYTYDQLKNLAKYVHLYDYIKIVAASENAALRSLEILGNTIDRSKIIVLPSGIISENKLQHFSNKQRNNKCLIYFKNRNGPISEQIIRK